MAEQVHTHKTTTEQRTEASQQTLDDIEAAERTTAQQDLLDDELLDEIDAVLEENAQQFVHDYVQKGGQ